MRRESESIILLGWRISGSILYLVIVPLVVMLLLLPIHAIGQSQQYQVLKSDRSETFAFPYSAANLYADSPLTYTYDSAKGPSWIFTITNNLTYAPGEDSKTIVRLEEPEPSEKYIEIAMYGGDQMKYWVAVNLPGEGYAKLYSQELNGWTRENAISLSNVATAGLSVTDGKRIVVDRFDLGGFNIGSVTVYGKDDASSPANAVGGTMTFDLLFGSFEDSPLYLVPAIVMAGVGGVVIVLLLFKKRKASD